MRRIAVETHAVDPTSYERDVWAQPIGALDQDDDGRRNFVDLAEFISRFESMNSADLMAEFPDLYCDDFDAAKVIDMYRRFAAEARAEPLASDKVPAIVKESFKSKFPEVSKVEWKLKGDQNYEAEFKLKDVEVAAKFDAKGKWLETASEEIGPAG